MVEKEDILILVEKTISGSKECENKLYDISKRYITDQIRIKFPKTEYVEDCVSEILIKAFSSLKKYNEKKGTYFTWLNTITKNYMIDLNRKNRVVCTSINYGEAYSANMSTINNNSYSVNTIQYDAGCSITTTNLVYQTPSNENPYTSLEYKDTLNHVENQININDLSMLKMKTIGYSYKEVASEFNVEEKKLKNKLNYVIKKMKKKK
jgi:RNA polymerase sigma factor (sigma-70 family)